MHGISSFHHLVSSECSATSSSSCSSFFDAALLFGDCLGGASEGPGSPGSFKT